MNLRFQPKALRQQFIKTAQPFAIQGPLSHPQLRLTSAPVAGAVVEVLAFPFNLLDTIVQPGPRDPGHTPCRVIQTSRTAGGLLNLPIGGRQGAAAERSVAWPVFAVAGAAWHSEAAAVGRVVALDPTSA